MLPTPDEAEAIVLANVPELPTQNCALDAACGRILRRPVIADRDLPPFDRVTMDGFALSSGEVGAGRREFDIAGFQPAGSPAHTLADPATCIEIATGAVLPPGADCIVPYEETRRTGNRITLAEGVALPAGRSIHRRASDFPVGHELVPVGTRITGREIAVAAACGYAELTVSQLPRIAIIATGDELVNVSAKTVASHQIRRSNDHALRAALLATGFPGAECRHVKDQQADILSTVGDALSTFDVVLLTGGVSKGKLDLLPAALEKLGVSNKVHGVSQRPGKPFWFGSGPRDTPVFALPGNPVSTYTCFHRYVLPALARMSAAIPSPRDYVGLASAVTFRPPLAYFLPVRLEVAGDGTRRACHRASNTSGDFAGLVGTDGFLELPAGTTEFPAGTVAMYRPWV